MENCIFCKIIKGEIPSYKIYENDYVYAFLDIAKDAYGHTLVIPKNHSINIFDTNDNDLYEVIKATKLISSHYKEKGFTGINILNANNKIAGQSVLHLHFHIIPRKENDNLNAWPFKNQYEYDLAEICSELKID